MKPLLKHLFVLLALLTATCNLKAQIGIGTIDPDTSVMLEIRSTNKGILIPRVDNAETANTAKGSLLFDNNTGKFKYYNGTNWLSVNPLGVDISDNVTAPKNVTVRESITIQGTSLDARTATVTADNFIGHGTIPVGGIIMWSGTTLPADGSWALCDGTTTTNGLKTPNLSGRFIVSYDVADPDYSNPGNLSTGGTAPGNYGGYDTLTLTTDYLPKHNHDAGTLGTKADEGVHTHTYNVFELKSVKWKGGGDSSDDNGTGGNAQANTGEGGAHTHTIIGNTGYTGKSLPLDKRPPYYVLAFIMRVK